MSAAIDADEIEDDGERLDADLDAPPRPSLHLRRDQAETYLDVAFSTRRGHVAMAYGSSPYRDANGKYRHRNWREVCYTWPQERDKLLADVAGLMAEVDAGRALVDVYVCPHLRSDSGGRRKHGALPPIALHGDLDGAPANGELYAALGGLRVQSGTEGHEHVLVSLAEPMEDLARWRQCQVALRDGLSGGADDKIADNDVLRLPGTVNCKAATPLPGQERRDPTPVTLLPGWDGRVWPLDELADPLGVDLSVPPPELHTATAGPVEVPAVVEVPDPLPPKVRAAVEGFADAPDKSGQWARLIGLCAAAGLDRDQAYAVVKKYGLPHVPRYRGREIGEFERCWVKSEQWRAERAAATVGDRDGRRGGEGVGTAAAPDGPSKYRDADGRPRLATTIHGDVFDPSDLPGAGKFSEAITDEEHAARRAFFENLPGARRARRERREAEQAAAEKSLDREVAARRRGMKVDDLARSGHDAEQRAEATVTLGTPARAVDGYERAPMHVLPTVPRELCRTVAASVQVQPELALMSALSALSFATGGGIEVDIQGHREPLAVWPMPTADPSERKTGTLNAVVRGPLAQAVEWFWESREVEQRRLESLIESCTSQIEQLRKHVGLLKTTLEEREKDLDAIEELTTERQGYLDRRVHRPLYSVSDATVEALEELMAERGGAVGSFTDEAALLATITGRYSANGGISLGSLNNSWSGSEFSVYRRGSSRGVERPFLVLALLIQPEPATRFLSALRGQADGFLSRWLFAEIAPYGERAAQGAELDQGAVAAWAKRLHALLERGWGRQQPDTLHLTDEAWVLYVQANDDVQARITAAREAGDSTYVEWLGKALNGHITRVAALFALADDPETRNVGEDAMHRAIELFGWLRVQAERVMHVTGGRALTVREEHDVLTWLLRRREGNRKAGREPMSVVQARDVQAGIRKYRGADRADVEGLLTLLEEAGWLIRAEEARRADAATRWHVRVDLEAMYEATGRAGEA